MGRRAAATQATQDDRVRLQAYFAARPPSARKAIKALRAAIRGAAPGAVDAFSYGIPAARLDGRILVWYAGWKDHCSLYPITPALLRKHEIDLSGYATAKGTVRFPLSAPIPSALVKGLVRARAAEVRGRSRRR